MKPLVLAALFVLALAAPACAGFDEGIAAYKRDDYSTALKEFRPLAEHGHAAAQFNVGLMYNNGVGVPKDFAKAMKWYRKAAKQDHVSAQFNIGIMYQKGQGVPKDHAEAVKWYRKAADQGEEEAQGNLGFMYGIGLGVPQDYVQAHMWYNLAAALGNENYSKSRDKLAEYMTPADVSKAQRLAQEWLAEHAD